MTSADYRSRQAALDERDATASLAYAIVVSIASIAVLASAWRAF